MHQDNVIGYRCETPSTLPSQCSVLFPSPRIRECKAIPIPMAIFINNHVVTRCFTIFRQHRSVISLSGDNNTNVLNSISCVKRFNRLLKAKWWVISVISLFLHFPISWSNNHYKDWWHDKTRPIYWHWKAKKTILWRYEHNIGTIYCSIHLSLPFLWEMKPNTTSLMGESNMFQHSPLVMFGPHNIDVCRWFVGWASNH